MGSIRHFRELDVYQLAMKASMILFELSKAFPLEERYSLTDQVQRCSRSVCANIAEAWRKRRYPNSFVSKLSDAEAAETQVWIEFPVKSGYLDPNDADKLDKQYESIQGKLIQMLSHPDRCPLMPLSHRVSHSPRHRVPASPHPRVSHSPCPL